MSHDTEDTTQEHKGVAKSYVIGFILSLVFTIIPYYLVVEKVVAGNALLATILSFAVLQMIVQVVFFLHIGREKRPHWQLSFLVATVGGIFLVVVGSIWIMGHLRYNMSPVTPEGAATNLIEKEGIYQIGGEETGACRGEYAEHRVTLKEGAISPSRIDAKQCDRLIFINEDKGARYIMFGSYEQPAEYAGEDMLTVRNGRNKMVVLNETGTHHFHDHKHPDASGSFTVTPQ